MFEYLISWWYVCHPYMPHATVCWSDTLSQILCARPLSCWCRVSVHLKLLLGRPTSFHCPEDVLRYLICVTFPTLREIIWQGCLLTKVQRYGEWRVLDQRSGRRQGEVLLASPDIARSSSSGAGSTVSRLRSHAIAPFLLSFENNEDGPHHTLSLPFLTSRVDHGIFL
jgi:hypothetical protein